MSVDRQAEGYNPNFDIDYRYGSQGELWVTSIRRALEEDRVEVKRDGKFAETGYIYVEYSAYSRRTRKFELSGIARTDGPELWLFVLGDSETGLVITTERLRAICRRLFRYRGRRAEERDGTNPTKGILVKPSDIMADARQSDIASRSRIQAS